MKTMFTFTVFIFQVIILPENKKIKPDKHMIQNHFKRKRNE